MRVFAGVSPLLFLAAASPLRAEISSTCFYPEMGGEPKLIACPETARYADKLPPLPRGLVWRSIGGHQYQPELLLRRKNGKLAPDAPNADPYSVSPIEVRPSGEAVKLGFQETAGPPPTGSQALQAARKSEAPGSAEPPIEPLAPEPVSAAAPTVFWIGVTLLALLVGAGGGFWLALRLAIARPPESDTKAGPPRAAHAGTTRPTATPPPESLLKERFELKRRIGVGGMGIVYDGFDHALGRRVAVKQMRSAFKDIPERREAFLREARIISHLSHPYIVGFHDVVEDGDELYLIFDFVDGKPLSQILRDRKRLPLEDCQRLFTYVCEAISCAHKNHVLHRDLKPSNIMVDSEGYAKVMDFGIAREAKDTITRLTKSDASGTPWYMAPEQHLGKCAKASDIYALGVCLYEALTGKVPFPGPDFLVQKERMKYSPPQYLAPELPKETELLFAATFALDPRKRVADAAELLESLRNLKAA